MFTNNDLMSKFFSKIRKLFSTEREIICISNNGIKSKRIGIVFLIWNISLVFWTAFTTVEYFNLREEAVLKETEIMQLNSDKQKLLSTVAVLEKNISNINNFIISLNKYDRFASVDETKLFESTIGNETNDNVKFVLDRAHRGIQKTNLALIDRINGLEGIKEKLNLKDNNIQSVAYQTRANDLNDLNIDKEVADSIVLKKTIDNNISYLENLEDFIDAMPFGEPMQVNYITSKFGTRLDPFIKTKRTHHGVDMVGSYMAKIHASSDGKVIFSGTKGGYGKVVILQHKYGMKTIYAHLNKATVKVGDKVKRGDIIGIQGSTGRSTGQHLHYEVLRNSQRFNPIDFVNVGSNLY